MSMIDSDRIRDLEQFANAGPEQTPGHHLIKPMESAADRVFGAQPVAVSRDEGRILQKIKFLAQQAGVKWYYSIPVKGGKPIEGPSIKLANDVARMYGNNDIDVREVDCGDHWVFYARFTDIETGYSLTRPFHQRKSQKSMRTSVDRQLDIAYQIGVSKATRNVITNALQFFTEFAFEEAYNSLIQKVAGNPDGYRNRALERFKEWNIDKARCERVIGRSVAEWTNRDIARVGGMIQAVQNNMAPLDEVFPPVQPAATETIDKQTGEIKTVADSDPLQESFSNASTAEETSSTPTAEKSPSASTNQSAAHEQAAQSFGK